jgi:TonB family protein
MGLSVSLLVGCGLCGCGRERVRQESHSPSLLPVEIYTDTSRSERLRVEPPPARVWLAKVSPARGPAELLPTPGAPPETLLPEPSPPSLEIDGDLKPPILRERAALVMPPAHLRGGRSVSVELDVQVDEAGNVASARWAGGAADSALVEAALECATRMRFYPALKAGRPVAVWCRQRFDFGAATGR